MGETLRIKLIHPKRYGKENGGERILRSGLVAVPVCHHLRTDVRMCVYIWMDKWTKLSVENNC